MATFSLRGEMDGETGTWTFPSKAERESFRLGWESAGGVTLEAEHSDGGTCCECGGPHDCQDCPVFD